MLFSEITGQQDVKERLIRSVQNGRIGHAQLFLGPEGSGSLPLAIAYARFISCRQRTGNDSCGQCPSCIKYAKLVHPDFHIVLPITLSKDTRTTNDVIGKWRALFLENPYLGLNEWIETLEAENKQAVIGTDEAADILRKLNLTTYEAEYKVMLIWLPEKMNTVAANKLLKILEEPTGKTIFLLVCENADFLLATVLSRTQLIRIHKIRDEDMKEFLIKNKGLDTEKASRIVHLSEGKMNDALSMCREEEDSLLPFFDSFSNWMRFCFRFDAAKVLAWADNTASLGREKQKRFLQYSLHMIRECLVFSYGPSVMLRLEGKEQEFVKKFAPFIHSSNMDFIVHELNLASRQIERNANPKILFLHLSFRLNELLNLKA